MISGNIPNHLLVAARSGFLATAAPKVPAYSQIASTFIMDAKSVDLVDIGAAPMPLRNKGRATVQEMIEKTMAITPLDWDITVGISHNAVQDDQTGQLERKARSAGANFQRHMGQQAFKALNDGDGTNFGLAYDGNELFDDAHVDKGANYATAQDNKFALALSMDNFETVRVAASLFRDDQGQTVDFNHNLLVVPPAYERIAANITGSREDPNTADRAINPYAGNTSYVVSTQMDSTAWVLVAANEQVKPVIVAIREQPNLQRAWFDPNGPDGGMYYFKFYARYTHVYGEWRAAAMGNT